MKKKKAKNNLGKYLMIYFMCSIILTLLAIGFIAIRKSKITAINRSLRAGREAFVDGDYKRAILNFAQANDTLSFNSDEVKLNTAHALFHLSGAGTSSKEKSVSEIIKNTADSLLNKQDTIQGKTTMDYYTELSATSPLNDVASVSFNQIGVINYRDFSYEVTFKNGSYEMSEQTLQGSADYFKEALRKNPDNEIARYNYEMIKKKLAYPELIMKRVRAMVKENRYNDAHKLMKAAIAKDPSIEAKNNGFLKRLEDIIKIDDK
jgi:tetratricopeptide (TPR) repeat protein